MGTLPVYVWLIVAVAVIAIPVLAARALTPDRTANRIPARAVAAGWVAWVVVSAGLGAAGAYRQSSTEARPWIGVAFAGALLVALLGARLPAVRRALADPGVLARLTRPHSLRVAGVAFIIALLIGQLPPVFALPAGLGDIAIGVAAPFVARRLARGDRRGAVWFNVLGLLDLVVALSIGFLAGLGPTRLIDASVSTAAVGLLPLVLIPTTAVPLLFALHLLALARLRTAKQSTVYNPAGERSREQGAAVPNPLAT
jgi:hypothetical protein